MSKNRKLVRVIQNFYQQFQRKSPSTVKEQSLWLLRSFIVTKKRPDWVNAGFVLPTVAMVSLVVVLLTIAILFRSFERSKNASNVRVNQAVLNAAMPAIDRARAKIDRLFTDPTLPRSTPSDNSLYNAFIKDLGKYTFGDETPLEVRYDLDGNNSIERSDTNLLEERETIKTAWRFPVDTDNNGKYDSFTLYGVFFRSPTRGNDGKFDRARTPLDARTPPMDDGSLGGQCSAARGTSFSLIGDSGWYKSGANIKKSFFVYATTVPITDTNASSKYGTKYETYKGNKGFSAVEFQQDQERVPINNNAVVYEDDLEITPGAGLEINGRIFTNSNFFTARSSEPIRFYQVSNQNSCFYQAKNSKIIVGGNLGHGRINGTGSLNDVQVDLFRPGAAAGNTQMKSGTKSVDNTSGEIAYNSQAYTQRINLLVQNALSDANPTEVQENIDSRTRDNPGLDAAEVRREELEAYFKKRTRKVPFAEVPFGTTAPTSVTLQNRGTDRLRGPNNWIYPFSITNNNTSYTNLTLYLDRLEATEPNKLQEVNKEEEKYLGDRVLLGNNLPALWYDPNINDFVGRETNQDVLPKSDSTRWTSYSDEESKYRYRTTKIEQLISLEGASERDGFFEVEAAKQPQNSLDNVGGMRVVTGAGIYVDGSDSDPDASFPWDEDIDSATGVQHRSFLHDSRPEWDTNFVGIGSGKVLESKLKFGTNNPIRVWSDAMPMTPGKEELANNPKGKADLLMRATAVYHYKDNAGKDQVPIACVSSYYNPTNKETAQNESSLKTYWNNNLANQTTTSGKSNNGIVYARPYSSHSARLTAVTSTYKTQLNQQARLVFPNGRFVNEPLRTALEKKSANKTLSMADNSAIDTAVCAIKILTRASGFTTPAASPPVPHGAIYETAFLDAREIKSIEQEANVTNAVPNYTRSIEERQPLEVRVTVLDLDKLRNKTIGGGSPAEYLLPNSGIIYATRDDALQDLSHSRNPDDLEQSKLLSSSDYKLDSTRRPNGIMLINGKNLERDSDFRYEEKGLILASNVPAYIKGDFNLHVQSGTTTPVEEFTTRLRDAEGNINWGDFYSNSRKTLDDNFACRKGDPRLPSNKCGTGDSWRPATVIADAVTVLSDNFRFGFRNEGDYDLRNNQGDFKSADYQKQGFFDNNFLTSREWFNKSGSNKGFPKDFDSSKSGYQGSSYLNNFVTPIQRRVEFGEYLMEVCTKIPVSSCTAGDWSLDGAGMKATDQIDQTYNTATHKAGTTVDSAASDLQPYARRVAFARKLDGTLVIDDERSSRSFRNKRYQHRSFSQI